MTDINELEVCVDNDRFYHMIRALSNVATTTVLEFHRDLGMKGAVLHPENQFHRDFQLAPSYFQWTTAWDKIPKDSPIRLPMDFGVLIKFYKDLRAKEFLLSFKPVAKTMQAATLTELRGSQVYAFQEETRYVDIPKNIGEIYPAVNSETYPFMVRLSRTEFSRQVQSILCDNRCINIGIVGNKIIFYAEDEGTYDCVLPCSRFEHSGKNYRPRITGKKQAAAAAAAALSGEIVVPAYFQSFNEQEKDPEIKRKVSEQCTKPPANNSTRLLSEDEHGKVGAGVGIVQVHRLRFFAFACIDKLDASEVIIGMSPHYGLVLLFPLTRSLDKDRLAINENSYFRYRQLPYTQRDVLPLTDFAKKLL